LATQFPHGEHGSTGIGVLACIGRNVKCLLDTKSRSEQPHSLAKRGEFVRRALVHDRLLPG
jgi:hypothetical protein